MSKKVVPVIFWIFINGLVSCLFSSAYCLKASIREMLPPEKKKHGNKFDGDAGAPARAFNGAMVEPGSSGVRFPTGWSTNTALRNSPLIVQCCIRRPDFSFCGHVLKNVHTGKIRLQYTKSPLLRSYKQIP